MRELTMKPANDPDSFPKIARLVMITIAATAGFLTGLILLGVGIFYAAKYFA